MAVARVTLLHGFLGSPADWADVLGHLAVEITCDCVALAELGCTSIDEASRQLATRLERSPCDLLVGYSLGGRIALDLAATRPALVPRLALFAAGMGIEDAAERTARAAEDDRRAEELRANGLEQFVDAWYAMALFREFRASPAFAVTRARRLAGDAEFWARCVSGCSAGRARPRWDALPGLASRTVLVVGERDERYAAASERAARVAPGIRVMTLLAAGHALPLESPAHCARIIEEAVLAPIRQLPGDFA